MRRWMGSSENSKVCGTKIDRYKSEKSPVGNAAVSNEEEMTSQ
ncbi:hypothetical protein T05_672 [Trichinella murrelli]|uniref:Uncharacterized protein n=1 Tax=Trichinella murrelli TaxID=144512 RepID=A0A0V0SQ60_9BILA|nr:hypothetical protein T05_672 [Trichinella murrelli]